MTTSQLARQLDGGALALLGRMTDRIDETDVGLRESPSNQRDQVSHPLDRLRRLGGNADARMFLEPQHIALVQHDVEVVEVFRQSPHLHVGALADDDGVIAVAHESLTARCATCTRGHVASTTSRPRARAAASVRSDAP